MPETRAPRLPHLNRPGDDDQELRELIDSWRYTGTPASWDDIVGHARQVLRCREMVERMRRTEDELGRLGLRLGRGMVISGPAGSGKTLLARAMASAAGRGVIVPPTAELTPALISRLYAQLARMEPVVVILDEAEAIIGGTAFPTTDGGCLRALLAALDGMARPSRGPLTIALTTLPHFMLDAGATRAGRLAPRLELSHPDPAERRLLFERAIARVPVSGGIDVERLVARAGGWTGAEITVAVEEAVGRSLIDGTDALTMNVLLEVIAERYVVEDGGDERWCDPEASARHEAGHAIYGHLAWPGRVAAVELKRTGGETRLNDEKAVEHTASGLRSLAGYKLAGMAADFLLGGASEMTSGADTDRAQATQLLRVLHSINSPFEPQVLEGSRDFPRGSERTRAAIAADVERESARLYAEVIRDLAPRIGAIKRLAELILAAPGRALSGAELALALQTAMDIQIETAPRA
jgi:ATP-dependent Zn protease